MTTKDYSSKQEKMIAEYLEWECVVASGARPCHPGDISSDHWLGECKTHIVPGNRVKFVFKEWDKICEEAMSRGKFAVLFADDGSQKEKNTWCMINARTAPLEYAQVPVISTASKQSLFLTSELMAECDSSDFNVLKFDFNGRDVLIMRLSKFKSLC